MKKIYVMVLFLLLLTRGYPDTAPKVTKKVLELRNVRNNNIGNVKHSPSNKWVGQTSKRRDKTFVSFETPEMGVRATSRVIKANLRATSSYETYVNRYASEKNEKAHFAKTGKLLPHLQNYANTLANSQGVTNTREVPTNINMLEWIKATAKAEGNKDVLTYFTDDIINRGLSLN